MRRQLSHSSDQRSAYAARELLVVEKRDVLCPGKPYHGPESRLLRQVKQLQRRRRVDADRVDAQLHHLPEILRDPFRCGELNATRVGRERAVGHALDVEASGRGAEELAVRDHARAVVGLLRHGGGEVQGKRSSGGQWAYEPRPPAMKAGGRQLLHLLESPGSRSLVKDGPALVRPVFPDRPVMTMSATHLGRGAWRSRPALPKLSTRIAKNARASTWGNNPRGSPPMPADALTVALVTEVFHDPEGPDRLLARLGEARAQGAALAVLPELPLNSWCPAQRTPDESDAEPPGGGRQTALARAANESGAAVLGGVILRDHATGQRRNTALLFDNWGAEAARYAKLHLPAEEGFWETDHYEPGGELPRPVVLSGFPIGIQICSDVNRPEPTHILGAGGALAVLAPRATPPETYERWRTVLRANAVTSGLYVVSVNRPGPDPGTSIGGPSLAIAPDGRVLVETTDPMAVVTLERSVVERARETYPGYLPVRGDLYSAGWRQVGG